MSIELVVELMGSRHWPLVFDERRVVIGRRNPRPITTPNAVVALDDIRIARQHIAIEQASGRVEVSDLGSPSGFYINGQRAQRQVVERGDEIQLPGATLRAFQARLPREPKLEAEARDAATGASRLDELARRSMPLARLVAQNPAAAEATLRWLSASPALILAWSVATSPAAPPDLLGQLWGFMPQAMFENPATPLLLITHRSILDALPLQALDLSLADARGQGDAFAALREARGRRQG